MSLGEGGGSELEFETMEGRDWPSVTQFSIFLENRVGQLLEQWWDRLAKRLAGETQLPELPPAVAEAFKAVWVSATEHGTELDIETMGYDSQVKTFLQRIG